MRTLVLLLLACACATPAPVIAPKAPEKCEAESFFGAAEPVAIAGDNDGGLAIAGTFAGTFQVRSSSVSSAGGDDVFVLRRAPDGTVRWLKSIGDRGDDRVSAVLFAPDGDVVVAGQTGERCFVARLAAADGAEKWATRLEGDGESNCRALALDAEGNVFSVAYFKGTLRKGATSKGSNDILAMRLSGADGTTTWSKAFGGKGNDLPRAIAIDQSGRILIAGQFGGEEAPEVSQIDFGGKTKPLTSKGDFDAFIVQLSPEGVTEWAHGFGDNGDDEVNALLLGPGGAIYASGHLMPHGDYSGISAHASGNFIGFVARFARDGKRDWLTQLPAGSSTANHLALDDEGHVWTTGILKGALPALHLHAEGKLDGLVAVLNADGTLAGGRSFGGPEQDVARGVARIPGGVAIAAYTRGEITPCGRPVGTNGQLTGFLLMLREVPR